MFIVGLTGGIGSGKSTAARLFAELGVPVIDADSIARELTAPGTEYYRKMLELLGDKVLGPDGIIDRKLVRNIIFNDSGKRRSLEELLHPAIIQTMQARARDYSSPYVVFSIPLLVEAGLQDIVDRILVIDAPEDLRIKRVMQRDHVSREEADRIMSAQSDRQYRLSQADDILLNDGDIDKLRMEIVGLDHKYMEISHRP